MTPAGLDVVRLAVEFVKSEGDPVRWDAFETARDLLPREDLAQLATTVLFDALQGMLLGALAMQRAPGDVLDVWLLAVGSKVEVA